MNSCRHSCLLSTQLTGDGMVFSELTLLKVGSWRVLSALCRICVCLCMHLCACVSPARFTA